jgi:hypothetical protein
MNVVLKLRVPDNAQDYFDPWKRQIHRTAAGAAPFKAAEDGGFGKPVAAAAGFNNYGNLWKPRLSFRRFP